MNIVKDGILEYTKTNRRVFHSFPEKAWMEYRTVTFISTQLTNLSFDIKRGEEIMDMSSAMGLPSEQENTEAFNRALEFVSAGELLKFENNKTAVAGFLDLDKEKTVCIRFDMDALPIKESSNISHIPYKEGFCSKTEGVMHSCGHDMHSALGLGLARLLSENKDKLSVNVLILFQPAEEGVRGAASLVNSGILDEVDYILSSHVWSNMPLGKIVCSQNGTSSTHKLDVIFKGKSAHAGICPEKGNNALLAAANSVVRLHNLIGRFDDIVRVNVGKIESGTARNIIADYSKIELELRCKDLDTELILLERSVSIIEKSAKEQLCSFEIIKQGEAFGATGSLDLSMLIKESASEIEFFNDIILDDEENRGCEDFTSMMNSVISNGGKACFMGIGASLKDKNLTHHTSDFDISEEIIAPTLELYLNIIQKINRCG
jgi:aminobenzoyl-glutamate utilization protein A